MRSFEIDGCVVTNTGQRLGRARVELTGEGRRVLARRTRADADGRFAFAIRGADLDLAEAHPRRLRVQVTDAAGKPLASATLTTAGDGAIEIVLDERQAEASGLRAADRRPVLREDFAPTLDAAIGRLAEADRPGAHAIIEGLTCGLPPFLVEPGLVDVARGVLRGRVDDLRRFDEVLARAEMWSAAKGVAVPRRDARWVADRMKALREKAPHRHDGPPAGPRGAVVELEARLLLLAAAGAAAPDDTAFVRNVELVYGQLAQGEHLAGILASAWDALDGRPDSFRRTLGSLGGCLPPDDKPFPYPPDGPLGWPDPGTLHWPGEPLPPRRPPFAECDAEALKSIFDAQSRAVRYTIDSVEPPRACPGHRLTIRGTNLRFEGQTGGVWFWSGRGTPVYAVPISATDTEIRVDVPAGAQCGPLELEVPVGTTVAACGIRIELYSGPTTPFHFHGGETVIKRFSHTAGTCPRAAQPVSFSWEVCNANHIELRLVHHVGGVDTMVTPTLSPTDGHYTHVLPSDTLDYELEAILTATGPCGVDQETLRFGVQRPSDIFAIAWTSSTFRNWHRNVTRNMVPTKIPTSLSELVEAVVGAEAAGAKVATMGSGWSYSDCVMPSRDTVHLVDTSKLNKPLTHLLPGVLRGAITPVFPASQQAILTAAVGPPPPIASCLIHVEAGITVHELNRMLDQDLTPPLAMPTLGGSNGQSIAGAFSTGTHGANPNLPPIADFVRALHLVGPGGQQWWIEPASRPITARTAMEARKARGDIDPCIKLVYDDDLFFSCLVSMGCAGVIYAVVVEAVQAHRLITNSLPPLPWPDVRQMAQAQVVAPPAGPPWFAEIIVSGSRASWFTTRAPTGLPPSLDPCATPDTTLRDAILGMLFGPAAAGAGLGGILGLGAGALGALLGAVPAYVIRRSAELHLPWNWGQFREIENEIELVQRLFASAQDIPRLISGADERAQADAVVRLFNVLWQLGLYVVDGRTIVEQAQNLFTTLGQRPPGSTILKSYTAMTAQCDALLGTWKPEDHSEFQRLIESREYGLPASRTLAFVDDLLAAADQVRATNDALILSLNIRFTGAGGALLGMQQAARTGHVEAFTVRGLAGNPAMHEKIDRIASNYGAWPHWGMFHELRPAAYPGLYPGLARWRAAMDRIARESVQGTTGRPNTFRHDFALTRGLLSPL